MIKHQEVTITAPNFKVGEFMLEGLSPLVQLKFPKKARIQLHETMVQGASAKGKKKREPRNFDEDFKQSAHISEEGWYGVSAAAFRNSMISACRIIGFQMTRAKLAVFVLQDGIDSEDGTPLVKIIGKDPEYKEDPMPNANGNIDLRVRSMWREWKIKLRVQYDADMFSVEDIANLLARAGLQVGIGEGRPGSKNSCGMGWGTFAVKGKK